MDYACIGDSIAVGVSAYLSCEVIRAKVGISTDGWIQRYKLPNNKVLVVSLGSNDKTKNDKLCNLFKDKTVLWIRPFNNPNFICPKPGDYAVSFSYSNDGIHPRSYKLLAKDIKYELESNIGYTPRVEYSWYSGNPLVYRAGGCSYFVWRHCRNL